MSCVSRYICNLLLLHFYTFTTQGPDNRQPTTWLSLVSGSSISRLDVFTQSFKHFKDRFFKVVVKEGGRSYFLNANGSTKFPFSWTGNPYHRDVKNIRTRRYPRIKPVMGRKRILKMDTHYPRVRVFLIPAC